MSTAPVSWSDLTTPERVKLLLMTRGVSSKRLCECITYERQAKGESAVTESQMSRWLNGAEPPDWLWEHVAALFAVELEQLVNAPVRVPALSRS